MLCSIDSGRNPWGKGKKGNWEGAWSDGSKEFTPEAQKELNHKFGNDSVFWICFEDLLRKYQHFDRTRLFMDSPDWRITQKWLSVEVPWHAKFSDTFRITLKKESPVVLVLSQLDDRYFEGLQGQYSFRLQFRLHQVDSPGEEDFIVRSHGNYLMERSVVTELKSLGPGTYSIFIQVVADRDTISNSVEDVVMLECRRKVHNDKLAQVGAMYDLAHSRGAVYTASKAAARVARDKASARESRISARKKNWERRHLSREIVRKQDKKNREKRSQKDANALTDNKAKEEKRPKDSGVQTEPVKEVQIVKEDKAIQTEEPSPASEVTPTENKLPALGDNDKGVQTIGTIGTNSQSTTSYNTPETPNSNASNFPGGPPPPPPPSGHRHDGRGSMPQRHYSRAPPQRPHYITSDGESSASPISDFDKLYSDDDHTLKPRSLNPEIIHEKELTKRNKDSDDEDEVDPWNAICIVGLRVYSKDENLELEIFDENFPGDQKSPEDDKFPGDEDQNGTDADTEDAVDDIQPEGHDNYWKDAATQKEVATKLVSQRQRTEGKIRYDNFHAVGERKGERI